MPKMLLAHLGGTLKSSRPLNNPENKSQFVTAWSVGHAGRFLPSPPTARQHFRPREVSFVFPARYARTAVRAVHAR
jgi:hypothetical protein